MGQSGGLGKTGGGTSSACQSELCRLSLRHDFCESWKRFLSRTDVQKDQLTPDRIRSTFLQPLMNAHTSMTPEQSDGFLEGFSAVSRQCPIVINGDSDKSNKISLLELFDAV